MTRSISPAVECVSRFHRLARHAHLDRLLETDQSWQPLRAFSTRDDPEVDLGLSHQRIGYGDPIVAGHGDLEAAAERRAVHRHHHGLGRIFHFLEQLVYLGCAGVRAPRQLLEALDVGAGDEGPARADDRRWP